jgi:carboxypeptidase PM20D1
MLEASVKTNIIPATATAQVDSRLLPGHDCVSFLSELRQAVGGPNVRIEPILSFASTQSPMNNELTEAVERVAAAMDERSIVLPALLGGFTDSHYFREKGIHAYGMVPLETSPEERSTLHGPDERVSVSSLQDAVGRMVDLLLELGG